MLSSFADGRVFGRRSGTADPWLLALHGWRRSHRDWDRVLDGLDAIAVDLPGFGATPPPSDVWGVEDYARSVMPVLKEMRRPAVVLGHSFGGSVAVHLAALAGPEQVGALVLSGSPLIRPARTGRGPSAGFRVARWLHARRLFPDSRMEQLRQARGSADYRAATGVMRDTFVRIVNEDVAHLLPLLAIPVELVWGSQDEEVPLGMAGTAAGLASHGTLTVLPGVGHDAPTQAPEQLRRVAVALAPRGVTPIHDRGTS